MDNKKPIILVVGKNEVIAKLIQQNSGKANYSVITADNGLRAIEVLTKLKSDDLPHCITMAIMMSPMDGFEACQRIKGDKRFKDIPLLITSSQTDIQNQIKAIEHGADDFIGKPIEPILLLKKVKNCVKLTQLLRDNARLNKELAGHKNIQSILKARAGADSDIGVDDSEF